MLLNFWKSECGSPTYVISVGLNIVENFSMVYCRLQLMNFN